MVANRLISSYGQFRVENDELCGERTALSHLSLAALRHLRMSFMSDLGVKYTKVKLKREGREL